MRYHPSLVSGLTLLISGLAGEPHLLDDKICRYCDVCSLLTVHQDQLEVMLARHFSTINPEVISNDYHVLGTLDRAKWN